MSDPNPAAAEPTPALAPGPLALAALYPACFNWERPKPLKIGIHHDLVAAGCERAAVQRALARYCHRPLYRRALRPGATRVDLHGQPAGIVTQQEVRQARLAATPRAEQAAALAARPPNTTPIPKEHLVPGRLELTVKFSELPRHLAVRDGLKIGIQTEEGIVTAILPAKAWRKLEQAAKNYPRWVAALSGSLERFADGEIALKNPALQVFEKKARPEVAAEGKAPESA
ncbi:MAG: ProQ/FinO family protein [Candidatus Contendobacter sp.]|nr:ProQ/FinO family protein [Candidatus Contendobacter sp.]